jgi:hypothetical protein
LLCSFQTRPSDTRGECRGRKGKQKSAPLKMIWEVAEGYPTVSSLHMQGLS